MNWSPQAWENIGIIGLLIILMAAHFWLYVTSRLVPGKHHDEIVKSRDDEIASLRQGRAEDARTIRIQSEAIARTTAAEETATQLLAAVREIAERERR